MRRLVLVFGSWIAACGGGEGSGPGSNIPQNTSGDGGSASDGASISPDGGATGPDGGQVNIPPSAPQIRYATPQNETFRIDPSTMQFTSVIASAYGSLTRVRDENAWDFFDPVTGRYVAQLSGNGGQFLYSVNGDPPQKVSFDGSSNVFQSPITWGVMSADGQRIYLSTPTAAYVANRKNANLEFSALAPVGGGVRIVHDVSRDNKRIAVSGHRPIKWGDHSNVVAPRQVSVYEVAADGTLGADKTSDYPPLQNQYVEVPSFLADSTTLLYEGDDDIDTGDRLFVCKVSGTETEIFPQALSAQDFNTPCALPDDRVVFWESDAHSYTLRMFDRAANKTVTARTQSYAFTGYIRCR